MSYNQFKQKLKQNEHLPDYYQLIVFYKNEILEDCHLHGQNKVAPQLNMTASKLSAIVNILRVI